MDRLGPATSQPIYSHSGANRQTSLAEGSRKVLLFSGALALQGHMGRNWNKKKSALEDGTRL